MKYISIFFAFILTIILSSFSPVAAAEPEALSISVEGQAVEIYLYKPEGAGPFPLLMMSHGTPRIMDGHANYDAGTLSAQASALSAQGVAVAVVIRRGYGGSGHWVDSYGGCEQADFYGAGLAGARDIGAAIKALSARPDIDRSRVALIGVSAGGWASLAAGTREKVRGVISFAGGRGSRGPDNVCSADALVAAAARYGRASRVPELWIYSENDHFFGPDLARQMHTAFTKAGGHAKLVMAPPYSSDGHQYFYDVSSWLPQVTEFLQEVHMLR